MSDARRRAEEALANYCGAYTECMDEDGPCDKKLAEALRALLAETAPAPSPAPDEVREAVERLRRDLLIPMRTDNGAMIVRPADLEIVLAALARGGA